MGIVETGGKRRRDLSELPGAKRQGCSFVRI
jgi:hypothetical protein